MSHYIENTFDIEPEPLLNPISKEFIMPSPRKLAREQHTKESYGHKKLLKLMFFQLKNTELEKLRYENRIQMKIQFEQLRSKLARRVNEKYS
jgi:hypothetical protein